MASEKEASEESALEETVVGLLKKKKMTLSLAESCTGGAVAADIVNVPGASEVFMCGYVTYTNRAKQMAKGGAKAAKTDICLSVTGLAGPGGGTEETPVGTVFMGCYCAGKTTVREFHFEGDRKSIRDQAVEQALTFICDRLRKYDR